MNCPCAEICDFSVFTLASVRLIDASMFLRLAEMDAFALLMADSAAGRRRPVTSTMSFFKPETVVDRSLSCLLFVTKRRDWAASTYPFCSSCAAMRRSCVTVYTMCQMTTPIKRAIRTKLVMIAIMLRRCNIESRLSL
jgi:hypothetical protein